MLNLHGYKKCEANQKQHCKWLQVTKTFNTKKFNYLLEWHIQYSGYFHNYDTWPSFCTIITCDWICENMHTYVVHTSNFSNLKSVRNVETCRVSKATIPLSFLQIYLYTVPTRFSESLN